MRIIQGSKIEELKRVDVEAHLSSYNKIHIDIGTGDGRYVYKKAVKDRETMYIGIDPSERQLKVNSKRARKNKILNALFATGSIEIFPEELYGVADSITVILPWGTLLQGIVNGTAEVLEKIKKMFKPGSKGISKLEIVFGYSQDAEPSEVRRLGLDKLDKNYISEIMVPAFAGARLKTEKIDELTKTDLNNFETTWSKKLRFGQDRPLYYMRLTLM